MLHITPWERDALQMLADGIATDALANHMGTSELDVAARLNALFSRMGAASQSEALAVASRRGLLVTAAQAGRAEQDATVSPR